MIEMEKAQRLSLTAQVEATLRSALIVGKLKPGARLVTRDLAAQLGTSITPVREALLRLVSAGALNATPAAAFLVPEMTLARYQEITLIRKQLEGLAVRMATPNITKKQLSELKKLCDRFMQAKLSGEVETALEANRAFRFTLYGYAHMPTLLLLIEQLWVQIGPCLNYLYPQSMEMAKGHNYDHLLEALQTKDVVLAEQVVMKAIDDGAAILLRTYFV
ncbi:Transcriptional regulator, GntR family [Pantoea sp. AS-PWVM4]|uniref:GntR family transcriptional regulator n=1 Tax=Pantoea sp. AS-PWVM4 TaxID=1332069 RepID=UPI0003AC93AB|nr:GntR family transcriptional regulator [Pantoea sp. AS-PWVM4]ERK09494.1 Transcriptional regulator, GntR family [Pantoea sp. AS-PWVM4]